MYIQLITLIYILIGIQIIQAIAFLLLCKVVSKGLTPMVDEYVKMNKVKEQG